MTLVAKRKPCDIDVSFKINTDIFCIKLSQLRILFTTMVTWNKYILHNTNKGTKVINTFSILLIMVFSYFVIIVQCDHQHLEVDKSSIMIQDNKISIPRISIDDLVDLTQIKENKKRDRFDILKDEGGKYGVFAITDIGIDYKEALEEFYKNAPTCFDQLSHNHKNSNIPKEVQLPDGSTRRTFATENKEYPDCLQMTLISKVFDDIDKHIATLLTKLSDNQELVYTPNDNTEESILLQDAPIKDHIHVYTKHNYHQKEFKGTMEKDQHNNDDHGDDNHLVPFHVDNGIYLLLTPFPNHGLEVELSNGKKVSTKDVDSESVLVLMGRGLTDWLLQVDEKRSIYHATPHGVPSLKHSDISSRSVYARMKVAPASAIPTLTKSAPSKRLKLKTFENIFMEMSSQEIGAGSDLCSVDLEDGSGHVQKRNSNDTWTNALNTLCEAGEEYCWMSCRPLPSKCPSKEKAKCYSAEKNITCG